MPLKLDDLPVEIIQRIASLGPSDSALALLRVNKHLNKACNDRQVFREVIENGNGYDLAAWDNVLLPDDASASIWARYALADLRAREWFCKDVADQVPLPNDSLTWMPQLASCFHPCLVSADKVNHYNAFQNALGVNVYVQAFCLAMRVISTTVLTMQTSNPWLTWGLCQDDLRWLLRLGMDDDEEQETDNDEEGDTSALEALSRQCGRAIAVVGALTDHQIVDAPVDLRLKAPGDLVIDYSARQNIPLPFDPHTVERFATCHLAHMTGQRYLEAEEWTGIYSKTWDTSITITRASFEPMHDVWFSSGQEDSLVRLAGRGTDGIGRFELHGTISSENGVLSMGKEYDQGHSWKWDGFMTPFGMVGTWGEGRFGGWFWLHKKYAWYCYVKLA